MPDLAGQIDSYYQQRGSPMAGRGQSIVRAGRRYGVDPRLLVGISIIESSGGKATKLPHNAWNWGVHRNQSYESYDDAINDVARGLRQNYLDQGLTTPQAIVSKYAPSSDGNDEGNWANVVSGVMHKLGGTAPVDAVPIQQSATAPRAPGKLPPPPPPLPPVLNRQALGEDMLSQFALGGGRIDINALPGMVASHYETPKAPALPALPQFSSTAPDRVPPIPSASGGFLQLPTKWKSTHPTDNLEDEGFTHAIDIMGSPGTAVGAPVSGTILRHGSAQGGSSLWFRGDDGRTYWIGRASCRERVYGLV